MEKYLREIYGVNLDLKSPIIVPGLTRRHGLLKLFKYLKYTKGAEIGVAGGRNSERMCRLIPGLNLLCVDAWEKYEYERSGRSCRHQMNHESNYEMAQRRLTKYNATLLKSDSVTAAKTVSNNSLDFVYIDANHYYQYVMNDLIEWGECVRSGGIISGHDYFVSPNCDVIQTVNEYVTNHKIDHWFITDESQASFFWMKL